MSKIFAFLLFIFSVVTVFGQTRNAFVEEAQDYINKAMELKEISFDSAIDNLSKAEQIAAEQNNSEILAEVYYSKAKVLDTYQLYDSSAVLYAKAAPYYLEVKDSIAAAKCFINIGATQYYYGHYKDAIETYNEASECLKGSNRTDLLSKVYNNLALIYKAQGRYIDAIEYFQHVLELHELESNSDGVANVSLNIGTLYWEHNNQYKALEYFEKALDIYESSNDQAGIAYVYNNIGLVYNKLDSTQLALGYYNKALEINLSIDDKIGVGTSLLNKAILLDEKFSSDTSEVLYREALDIFEADNYYRGIFVCKLNLSRIYSDNGQYLEAVNLINEAFSLQNIDQPIKYLADGYIILAESYSGLGKYKDANFYYRKYFNIQDSIFSIEVNNQLSELQSKYEYEKAQHQLEIYEQKNKVQALEIEKKEKRIRNSSIILTLSLIFIIVLVVLYVQKQRTYLKLVKQNVLIAKTDIENEKQGILISSIADSHNSGMSDKQKKEFLEKLLDLMNKEKFFMKKQITINDIAIELKTNRNYLSQLINDYFNTNFNNFINEYRVKEARKLLLTDEYFNYTIEGIGETVGFHSKATFNSAFKKITGVTPSFFRNNSGKV